jgi:anti-anti-sigma factor
VRGFELTTESRDGAVVVTVAGEIDLSNHEQLRETLVGAAGSGGPVVVELSECDFIDSSGIRALLLGHEAVTGNGDGGGGMLLAGPQPQVMRVLEMTGVNEAVPVHPSVDEALSSL